MRVKNIIPNDHISSCVDRILVIENNVLQKPFSLPLYANGVPTLLFLSVKGKLGNSDSNYLTLFGQTTLPEQLTLYENFKLVVYFFKPHTLISLFGIEGCELTDKPIDLNLLFPQKAASLQNRLLNCESLESMIQSLNNYVFSLVKSSKSIASNIIYASGKIAGHYSKESLLNVQRELKITERTFQRMFEKYIGTSPNTYRRICQFYAAFTDLNLGNYKNLSDIAYNHGYADQSHYIRAFKEFTKINPSEYLTLGTH